MIGKNIKFLRDYYNEKQETVAKALGVARTTLSQYENGTREVPCEVVERLCIRYNVLRDDLIRDDLSELIDLKKINGDDLVELVDVMFPMLYSESALENKFFAHAYTQSLSILQGMNNFDNLNVLDDIVERFNRAWSENRIHQAVPNTLTIILLFYTYRNSGNDEIRKICLQSTYDINDYYNIQLHSLRDPRRAYTDQYAGERKAIYEKYEDLVYEYIKILKNDTDLADLGDYYLLLLMMLGFNESTEIPEEHEKMINAGRVLLYQLLKLDNRYVTRMVNWIVEITEK